MKKILLTFALLLGLSFNVAAQEAGKMWLGGTIGLSSDNWSGEQKTSTNFSINPEFGYNLNNKLAIAISLGYGHVEGDLALEDGTFSYTSNEFTVSPFVRYTVVKGNIGSFFVDGGLEYTHSHMNSLDYDTNIYGIGFRPGISINVTKSISLIAKCGQIGYKHTAVELGSGYYNFKANNNKYSFDLFKEFAFGMAVSF
ncbi:hypothetical protein M2132_000607 [Dysgonomonas sp. PH5-45]|uniref:outer membrane beta-barrel protein n=1 Tax=unclassified Dysgonomonas TaxID=2630389 RepID=UPI00247673A5|nr:MULTISPECIES: outer membrane beta-barrel protein [unclassified Dysgonomonas]MDH6354280.1 hypothetical protein [Dysgonomonas sp. PH5-45]MDH6387181.1 hypothetical protein [Dysgonomonas sp. PH5-37]